MSFAADELVTLLDRRNAFNNLWKKHRQRFQRLMGQFVADRADNGAGNSAHNVRAIPELADFLNDRAFLFFGNARLKDDYHITCS